MRIKINGVGLHALSLFEIKGRGIVMTFRIISLPEAKQTIDTALLANILKDQDFMGCKIEGVEYFATMSQHVGSNIGLLLKPNRG